MFHLDDLQEAVDANTELRRQAVSQVEEMIRGKVAEFFEKITKVTGPDKDNFCEDSEVLVDA